MANYLKSLIDQGEHQQLDFKYCISDSKKIARTLSAFANTDGGTLLIGVRDNGSIAGVSSEEEYYMLEAAAEMYCKPAVNYRISTHRSDSKSVLEVKVEKGDDKPYLARNDEGKWLAYIRKDDQNLLANRILLNVWRKEKEDEDILIRFQGPETILLNYLREHKSISFSMLKRIAAINSARADKMLTDFIILGIISPEFSEKGCRYVAGSNFDDSPGH